MRVLGLVLLGWCALSALMGLLLGRLLRGAAGLAAEREPPPWAGRVPRPRQRV